MAINVAKQTPKVMDREMVIVAGSFRCDTANPPTNVLGAGVTSVVRSAAGVYLVTFDEVFPQVIAWSFSLRSAGTVGLDVQGGDYVAASKTVQIKVFTSSTGAALDFTADVDNVVNFAVFVKNAAG